MSKTLKRILNRLWNVMLYLVVYPVRNVIYLMSSLVNMMVPRRSTQTIVIITAMFYILAFMSAKYSHLVLPWGHDPDGKPDNKFVDSLPCLGLETNHGCHAMRIIILTSILMFPLLFWNQDYLFGSVDCIDYHSTLDRMRQMMADIKTARLNDKIEQILDKYQVYDEKDRRRLRRHLDQQLIQDQQSDMLDDQTIHHKE